jgi:hypothetical protein
MPPALLPVTAVELLPETVEFSRVKVVLVV